ncbi:Hypothetical predicted protein [Lecanosticta acicola]|uniref:Uncharacterized protein n=1 Tax=Lecanosticta acicola TaxID=111012 RepID=A0AAI9ED03_9PEZI|nr:Hypothetical predicted protein [Lecanosticta acicola]
MKTLHSNIDHANKPLSGSAAPQRASDPINLSVYIARQYDQTLTESDLKLLSQFSPDYAPPEHRHRSFATLQMEYQKLLRAANRPSGLPSIPVDGEKCEGEEEEQKAIAAELVAKGTLCTRLMEEHHFFLPMQTSRRVIDLVTVSLKATNTGKLLSIVDTPLFFTQKGIYSPARILPALFLASQILTRPSSIEFFHALMFGKKMPHLHHPEDYALATNLWRPYERGAMPAEEIGMVTAAFEDIAANLDYKFMPIQQEWGHTSSKMVLQEDGSLTRKFHITLQAEKYRAIGDLTGPETMVLRGWFTLATTIVHEIAHAFFQHIASGAGWSSKREPVFEDDQCWGDGCCGELGHSLEKHIYGVYWPDATLSDGEITKHFDLILET